MTDLGAAIAGAKDGDEASFAVLYRALQPGLLRYLRILVGDDAEDVAADTWLQIARDLSTFQGDEDGFRGWSATIGRHRAMDHLRRLRRRPVASASMEELVNIPDAADPAAYAIDGIGTDAALRLIAGLPRDQAEAVLLRVVVGLDAGTAARVLGKSVGAVRTAAYRGLRRLRETLDPVDDPELASAGVTSSGPSALKDTR